MSKPYTVVIILEAAMNCEEQVKKALLDVVEPSRQEDACVEYKLHQDRQNPCRFILYENWSSPEAHQLQFEKPYIKALAEKTQKLLSKPYLVFFADELTNE